MHDAPAFTAFTTLMDLNAPKIFGTMSIHLPVLFSPFNNEILHGILDTPFVMLHSYVPKSLSFAGVTTNRSP